MKTNRLGANTVIRRQIVDEVSKGKYTPSCLSHMIHYDAAADYIIGASKSLGRPIDVVSVGCGDMWELKILLNGRYANKKEILCSYTGIDIIDGVVSPFGKKLSECIDFDYIHLDLMDNNSYPLPIDDESIDVVICTEFIEHIDKGSAQDVLTEIAGIARPGGHMYLTTPNANNSRSSDKYHLYEWGLDELLIELSSYWNVSKLVGTYINKRTFDVVNAKLERIPQDLLCEFRDRFTSNWCRVMLATPYPEYSEGIALWATRI